MQSILSLSDIQSQRLDGGTNKFICVCQSNVYWTCGPSGLESKEGGRPPEPMPLQEPFQEGCSWATWGPVVYIGYAGSAVAYFGVRGAYTLSLGALQWCAQWGKPQPMHRRRQGEQLVGILPVQLQ